MRRLAGAYGAKIIVFLGLLWLPSSQAAWHASCTWDERTQSSRHRPLFSGRAEHFDLPQGLYIRRTQSSGGSGGIRISRTVLCFRAGPVGNWHDTSGPPSPSDRSLTGRTDKRNRVDLQSGRRAICNSLGHAPVHAVSQPNGSRETRLRRSRRPRGSALIDSIEIAASLRRSRFGLATDGQPRPATDARLRGRPEQVRRRPQPTEGPSHADNEKAT